MPLTLLPLVIVGSMMAVFLAWLTVSDRKKP